MDHSAAEDRDLESGGTGSEDEIHSNIFSGNKRAKRMLGRLRSGILGYDRHANSECSSSTYSKLDTFCEDSYDNIDLVVDKDLEHSIEQLPLLEKKHMNGKRKNSIRKSSKPPRPPKGPTLNVSDLKLVMEFSELAMKKRARMKRIKALRKMKAEIASSSSSSAFSSSSFSGSLAAMVVTLLFFVVILFQGILARHGSSASLPGSPESTTVARGLISVSFLNSASVREGIAKSSVVHNLLYVLHLKENSERCYKFGIQATG
ncbi:uncharacterized protein LOC108206703 isoform X1 [Daucus carota subsp. sativus]|uniref:uncharacterized protein LOC108206703 isoform X1 n=1 Tax=Daucus carota subsp. sativus TaxID=79200 RepID=UPI0007EEFE56|nr:PREDICTED: uncharacterized protein LOC108206703 isoform X1 [Daucus carota subsp. sativus]